MHSRQYIITSCLAYHEIDCKRKLQNILSFWLTCQHLPSLAHVCQYLLKNQPHKPLTLQTHAHESAEYITQPRLIIHSQTRTHPPTLNLKHTHTHTPTIYITNPRLISLTNPELPTFALYAQTGRHPPLDLQTHAHPPASRYITHLHPISLTNPDLPLFAPPCPLLLSMI